MDKKINKYNFRKTLKKIWYYQIYVDMVFS